MKGTKRTHFTSRQTKPLLRCNLQSVMLCRWLGRKNSITEVTLIMCPGKTIHYCLVSPNVAEVIHKIIAVLTDKACIFFNQGSSLSCCPLEISEVSSELCCSHTQVWSLEALVSYEFGIRGFSFARDSLAFLSLTSHISNGVLSSCAATLSFSSQSSYNRLTLITALTKS